MTRGGRGGRAGRPSRGSPHRSGSRRRPRTGRQARSAPARAPAPAPRRIPPLGRSRRRARAASSGSGRRSSCPPRWGRAGPARCPPGACRSTPRSASTSPKRFRRPSASIPGSLSALDLLRSQLACSRRGSPGATQHRFPPVCLLRRASRTGSRRTGPPRPGYPNVTRPQRERVPGRAQRRPARELRQPQPAWVDPDAHPVRSQSRRRPTGCEVASLRYLRRMRELEAR